MTAGEVEWWWKQLDKGKLYVRIRDTGEGEGTLGSPSCELVYHANERSAPANELVQHFSTIEKTRLILSRHGYVRDELPD